MEIGPGCYIAPTATLIGNISLAAQVSVWFGAILRADRDSIKIGARSNVQDGVIMHVDPGFPIELGQDVVVGHAALIHGARVGDQSLIGMRATLLNGATVGKACLIGAHSLVTEGTVIPDFSLALGTPARVVRQLSPEQVANIQKNAAAYLALAERYLQGELEIYQNP